MRRNLCLAASAVLLVAAGAWTSGGAPVQAQSAPAGRKLAFLVGVNKYAHAKLDDLQFAEADVEDLAEVLKSQGYEVLLLTASAGLTDRTRLPTKANVELRLKEFVKG